MPGRAEHPEVTFFETPADFRAWLAANHDRADELVVGFWKKATGRASITWPESVEEALCFGWIDGIRRSLSEEAYSIRFTPRRPTSAWSPKNLATYVELDAAGRIQPPGREAYERRDPEKTDRYSPERQQAELPPQYRARLDGNPAAADFFDAQPEGYRKTALRWVMSAKREATRERRLATLIADSANGLRIKQLRR